jgi:hypothetical protein
MLCVMRNEKNIIKYFKWCKKLLYRKKKGVIIIIIIILKKRMLNDWWNHSQVGKFISMTRKGCKRRIIDNLYKVNKL